MYFAVFLLEQKKRKKSQAIVSNGRTCMLGLIDRFTNILKFYAYLLNKGCSWQLESLPGVCPTEQQLMYANRIPSIVMRV